MSFEFVRVFLIFKAQLAFPKMFSIQNPSFKTFHFNEKGFKSGLNYVCICNSFVGFSSFFTKAKKAQAYCICSRRKWFLFWSRLGQALFSNADFFLGSVRNLENLKQRSFARVFLRKHNNLEITKEKAFEIFQ